MSCLIWSRGGEEAEAIMSLPVICNGYRSHKGHTVTPKKVRFQVPVCSVYLLSDLLSRYERGQLGF
ncbi:pleckstrin homology-like domain family B member 1 isoform X1 [Clarias magur]|uniref:Pleckstrin homology-like domain family B member 1 isoform X1 n=1 Tax=Clarias magur TaxID=1594786 RepID=A0A8J4UDR1_CLAMG|nr:pleckstrin homology-like domain family B member 1 isoform X1 [Clarias magur]